MVARHIFARAVPARRRDCLVDLHTHTHIPDTKQSAGFASTGRPFFLPETKRFRPRFPIDTLFFFFPLPPSFFPSFVSSSSLDRQRETREIVEGRKDAVKNRGDHFFESQPVEYTLSKAAHDRGNRSLGSFTLHSTYYKQLLRDDFSVGSFAHPSNNTTPRLERHIDRTRGWNRN